MAMPVVCRSFRLLLSYVCRSDKHGVRVHAQVGSPMAIRSWLVRHTRLLLKGTSFRLLILTCRVRSTSLLGPARPSHFRAPFLGLPLLIRADSSSRARAWSRTTRAFLRKGTHPSSFFILPLLVGLVPASARSPRAFCCFEHRPIHPSKALHCMAL